MLIYPTTQAGSFVQDNRAVGSASTAGLANTGSSWMQPVRPLGSVPDTWPVDAGSNTPSGVVAPSSGFGSLSSMSSLLSNPLSATLVQNQSNNSQVNIQRPDVASGVPGGSSPTVVESDPTVSAAAKAISAGDVSSWNTAYGWGDHAGLYAAAASVANANNWDTAYGWGNHASAGYVTGTPWTGMGYLTAGDLAGYATEGWVGSQGYVTGTPWTGMGYLTTETDPNVPNEVKAITSTDISNWNTAYGWGDHASGGYVTGTPWQGEGYIKLTSLSGSDPITYDSGTGAIGITQANLSITASQVSDFGGPYIPTSHQANNISEAHITLLNMLVAAGIAGTSSTVTCP